MRTSMNLPDGLLEEAKAKAASEGSTVTQLVIEGLRTRVASGAPAHPIPSLPRRKLGRASIDLSDNRAVYEVLNAEDDASYRDPR